MLLSLKLAAILIPLAVILAVVAKFAERAEQTQAQYDKTPTVQQQKAMPRHWAKAIKDYRQ